LLINGEGFDAVDVEDMVALILTAMTVPELSKRQGKTPMTTIALLSLNSCQARA
jgi:hypothetical protein